MTPTEREGPTGHAQDIVLSASGLSRVYGTVGSSGAVTAVNDISLGFDAGGLNVITGPSGSGKSTLLHLLSTLDRPTSGGVHVAGTATSGLGDRALSQLRREFGFMFQRFNLLPSLTAADNITTPSRLMGRDVDHGWLQELTERLGIAVLLERYPHQLSGGQQQRVAIGRALIHRPGLLFADEPTGSLDRSNAGQVAQLLRELSHDVRVTMVVVTHDATLVDAADRVVTIVDGKISGDQKRRREAATSHCAEVRQQCADGSRPATTSTSSTTTTSPTS
jgi:putative ABC transport system ATP-binding protein